MKAPALLSFNPELQRNLWLELTPSRLVAMPLALLLMLGGLASVNGPAAGAHLARTILWALLVLWGSRLAAESLGDEVAGRTWDVQRLSAQTPWGLTLGKLFGGAAFAWYGAAICAVALILLQASNVGRTLGEAALGGVTAQSAALFAVLLLNRFNVHYRRTHTTLAQIVGIIAGWKSGLLSLPVQMPTTFTSVSVEWYGYDFPASGFLTAVQVVSVGWLIFGSMRIVRRELGFIDGPLGWSAYTLYAVILGAGFVASNSASAALSQGLTRLEIPLSALGVQSFVWTIAASLAYLALLGAPVSQVSLKKLGAAAAAGNWRDGWRNLPHWAPSAAATAVVALLLAARLGASELTATAALTPIAALGFLMRDAALVTLVRLTYRQRNAMALLVMFLLLYAVLPFLLGSLGFGLFRPLFYPGLQPGFIGVLAPWIEAGIAWLAVRRFLRTPIGGS